MLRPANCRRLRLGTRATGGFRHTHSPLHVLLIRGLFLCRKLPRLLLRRLWDSLHSSGWPGSPSLLECFGQVTFGASNIFHHPVSSPSHTWVCIRIHYTSEMYPIYIIPYHPHNGTLYPHQHEPFHPVFSLRNTIRPIHHSPLLCYWGPRVQHRFRESAARGNRCASKGARTWSGCFGDDTSSLIHLSIFDQLQATSKGSEN